MRERSMRMLELSSHGNAESAATIEGNASDPLSFNTQTLANIIKLIEDAAPVKKRAHVKHIYFLDSRKPLQQPRRGGSSQ